ncbi:MAG TPA: AAA family ATPase [Panacibacter sp.]|nr:AAA family ATPase [Panacibacter sp.]HNP47038.1 AAA family ATPase [Panacibacter sp.]
MVKINLSILIIGKICSGKSTLAKDFSNWLNFPIASFGGYLEKYSKEHNLATTREALQDLGAKMIEENHEKFLNNVILHTIENPTKLIFEGVRHKVIVDDIKNGSEKTFSIFLDVNEDIRIERFINRQKSIDGNANAADDFYKRSAHKVERELDLLKNDCNYIIVSNDNYRDFLQALSINI